MIVVIAREDQILGRTWQILANLGNSWHFLAFLGGFRENLFGNTTAPLSNHEWFLVQNRFSHLFAQKDANSGFFQGPQLQAPGFPSTWAWHLCDYLKSNSWNLKFRTRGLVTIDQHIVERCCVLLGRAEISVNDRDTIVHHNQVFPF